MTQRKTAHLNALKHGLFAQQDLLEGEDPLEYKRFMESVVADLKPTNALQQTLAVRVAGIYWRLGRIPKYESSLFTWRYKGDAIETLERLSLYETRLSRLAERLTQRLEEMQAKRNPPTSNPGGKGTGSGGEEKTKKRTHNAPSGGEAQPKTKKRKAAVSPASPGRPNAIRTPRPVVLGKKEVIPGADAGAKLAGSRMAPGFFGLSTTGYTMPNLPSDRGDIIDPTLERQ